PVRENTDYALRVGVRLRQGPVGIKIVTSDPGIGLASVSAPEAEKKRSAKKEAEEAGGLASPDGAVMTEVNLYFASGDSQQVGLLFYNNGASPARKSLQVGRAEMFDVGPTPNQWTRGPRALIRGLQKNIFKTDLMRLLVIGGVVMLAVAGRGRALAALLAVPAYYLLVQSAFHTEYRYILAIHYFLFVMAAVAIYCMAVAIVRVARQGYRLAKGKNAQASSGSTGG
ncbi:MAG TPA: hypothetical protein VNI02_24380, partial [Blastocatellia bacterium]|nr:hypothetical protein [Blastocatellia bacterium]